MLVTLLYSSRDGMRQVKGIELAKQSNVRDDVPRPLRKVLSRRMSGHTQVVIGCRISFLRNQEDEPRCCCRLSGDGAEGGFGDVGVGSERMTGWTVRKCSNAFTRRIGSHHVR